MYVDYADSYFLKIRTTLIDSLKIPPPSKIVKIDKTD